MNLLPCILEKILIKFDKNNILEIILNFEINIFHEKIFQVILTSSYNCAIF